MKGPGDAASLDRVDLSRRAPGLVEAMDRPDVDPALLHATYRRFALVNRFLARWPTLYRRFLRPVLAPASRGADRGLPGCERGPLVTILDVGSGGGDLARLLAHLATKDGFRVEVTGIDPDPRAHRFARDGQVGGAGGAVTFRQAHAGDLVEEGRRYDLVVSNHVLHHLPPGGVGAFLGTVEALARRRALVADIERSPMAWHLFGALTRLPGFRGSLIRDDGLLSIRRSFTRDELQAEVPPGWQVGRMTPARLLALRDPA